MPTDVSAPIWCCDICRTRFGANQAAAVRCESAGPPDVLPTGELLLGFRGETYGTPQGFYLQRLYPIPGRVGTVASEWNTQSGHTATYLVDVDPAGLIGADGVLRLPDPKPREIQSAWLWPHRPGTLNLVREHWIGGHATPSAGPGTWVLDAVGLSHPDAPGEAEPDVHWTRPLTAPGAAVLDALGAVCEPAGPDPHRRFRWMWGRPLGALAAEAARGPDRVVDLHRARWWLHSVPAAALVDDVNDRWRRWRAGDPVSVPAPRLRCRARLSASKLGREMKALVAATGVDWPPRTSSDEYANLLVRTLLGYEMDTTELLFRAPHVIAVTGTKGGVGKSTLAAALARRLASGGRRVVLVDCDLTGPSQQVLFGLGPVLTDPRARRVRPSPTDLATLAAFSPGQLFGPDSKVGWDATTITQWLTFVGACLDLDDADVLVLDLPPGANAVHDLLFNRHRVPVTATVHVTTGHPLALADTERGLAQVDRHGHRHHLVENLSRAVGRGVSGELVEVRLAGDADQVPALAQRHGVAFGGSLPWAPDVAALAVSDELGALAAEVLVTRSANR